MKYDNIDLLLVCFAGICIGIFISLSICMGLYKDDTQFEEYDVYVNCKIFQNDTIITSFQRTSTGSSSIYFMGKAEDGIIDGYCDIVQLVI